MTVIAMVAYYGVGKPVRRQVDSILAQTYPDLRCYVVNDADTDDPPWPYLADIADPRLIRFDLPENRGRYFADAVVLAADTEARYWALCDPDDWSEPDRFAELVPIAAEKGMAQAPHLRHRGSRTDLIDKRLGRTPKSTFRWHAGWGSAVRTTERIRAAGGFHADMRIGYDTLLTVSCKLAGPWGCHPRPFTHKIVRSGSLTTAPETRFGSPARTEAWTRMGRLWGEMWRRKRAGLEIAPVIAGDTPEAIRQEVEHHAARLQEMIP